MDSSISTAVSTGIATRAPLAHTHTKIGNQYTWAEIEADDALVIKSSTTAMNDFCRMEPDVGRITWAGNSFSFYDLAANSIEWLRPTQHAFSIPIVIDRYVTATSPNAMLTVNMPTL